MKEIRTSIIISQGLCENPLVDRKIQSVLLHILSALSNSYGFDRVPTSEVLDASNRVLKEIGIPELLTQKIFEIYAKKFEDYDLSFQTESNGVTIEPFLLRDSTEEICIDKDKIAKGLSKVFVLHKPTYLLQRLEKANEKISDLSRRQIEFLSTSKMCAKKEISDRLAEMINRAHDHIYIMLAFYQEDVSFFANFLSNRILSGNLDLKIIYNPRDRKNREFIKKLYNLMGQTNREFFRVYQPENVVGLHEGRFIGNLHSKAVVTESELLVGSANLTGLSMYYNIENALYTNDLESVKTANSFFLDLWNKLRPAIAI